jgi:maltooligosyltrehalose trehalohydrolase
VDPERFPWFDAGWPGVTRERLVLYELHVGTFSSAGTFEGIVPFLRGLRRLGVTAIELMPVAEFPGRRNWGYDGVDLFAPSHVYGGPTGLRRLVDAAHRIGLGVILDVVYNHLGPDGNYLRTYADAYFTDRYQTPWGEALNYDGPSSAYVRELVIQNACHWLVEYHLDGLRLDATHAIFDSGPKHLLTELAETARAAVGPDRSVVLMAEDGRNQVDLVRAPSLGGHGLDAVWSDDFHHALHTALTGEQEGYYRDYPGTAEAVARTIVGGFYYQGQPTVRRGTPRGQAVTDEPASAFVFCTENHDQVGNRALGERLNHLVGRPEYAIAAALLILAPETPLLFMGQEFAASSPFLFFTDHEPELGRLVTEGRRNEFAHFSAFSDPARRHSIPDPQSEATFRRSMLDHAEQKSNGAVLLLYQHLLGMRARDPVFSRADRQRTDAAALGDRGVVVSRWVEGPGGTIAAERLVIANWGPAFDGPVDAHRLLARLNDRNWRPLLSTTQSRYGGNGERLFRRSVGGVTHLRVPARCAVVYARSA